MCINGEVHIGHVHQGRLGLRAKTMMPCFNQPVPSTWPWRRGWLGQCPWRWVTGMGGRGHACGLRPASAAIAAAGGAVLRPRPWGERFEARCASACRHLHGSMCIQMTALQAGVGRRVRGMQWASTDAWMRAGRSELLEVQQRSGPLPPVRWSLTSSMMRRTSFGLRPNRDS